MISSISSMGSYVNQMLTQSMQQRRDDLFTKVDSNGDGSIDTTEFSELAKKLSKDTGTTINADDAFSTYDANGDGSLSKDELDAFMKDNAPTPPDGMGGMGQMNMQPMQQNMLDDLFGKVDSNGDGSIDTTEFSELASNISGDTGTTINADDAFSTYDANGDGSLSKDELSSFMKDNAPPPPPPPSQMQNATSAYGTGSSSTDQISQLIELLKNQSSTDTSGSSTETTSGSDYLSKLIDSLNSLLKSNNGDSSANLTLINITA
jgi:Ca2+-binding EF-hand superfamily protein